MKYDAREEEPVLKCCRWGVTEQSCVVGEGEGEGGILDIKTLAEMQHEGSVTAQRVQPTGRISQERREDEETEE